MPARQSLFSLAAHRISFMSRQAMALPTLAVATFVTLAALPASGQLLTMPPNSGASSTRGNSNYQDLNLDALNLPPGTVSDAPQSQVSDSSISAPPSYNAGDFAPGAASYTGGGAAYSTALGAHLRARYNTRSYGQYQGNFDLGTSKFFSDGDRMWFIDGQVTMNDESQVGYNLGAGFRQMTLPVFPNSPDSEKIVGLSIWSDGSNTRNNDFISQLGLSFEYLGDRLDLRANTYIPLGRDQYSSDLVPTGELSYESNFLIRNAVGELETPLTVGEIEGAARISDLDLWGFTGVYGMGGEGVDTAGFRAGIRGYATPDVLLQIGVTHDDLFATNTVFSATWFIGRTHADSCLTGRLIDRMREPVMRNDYVAIYSEVLTGGDPLTDADTNEAARFVFVDANAAAGGTGTFESPFASLDDVFAASQDNDRVLINSGGTFTNQSLALRDGQQVLGFGLNANDTTPTAQIYSLNTTEIGTIDLPEPFTGANGSTVSTIDAAPGAAITLAQNNTVRGLQFDGGTNAIDGTAADIGSTTLQELTISNTTGDGIALAPSAQTSDFGATIDNIDFNNVGADDISVNGNVTPATTASVTINNIESRNNQGRGIVVAQTQANTTTTISNFDYDGGAASTAGVEFNQTVGATNLNGTSTITGGASGGDGVLITGTQGTVTVASGVTVNNVGGDAIDVNNAAGTVNFNGTVSGTSEGITVADNGNATITFSDSVNVSTGTNNGVSITGNGSGTVINFSDLTVATTTGTGVLATDLGTVSINGGSLLEGNTITTDTGRTLDLQDVVIGTAGVNFESVTTTGVASGSALRLNDLGGTGTVAVRQFSDPSSLDATSGGTLQSDGNTVDIVNAPNVILENVTINSSGTNAIQAVYNAVPTTSGDSDIALAANGITTNSNVNVSTTDGVTGDANISFNNGGSATRTNAITGDVTIGAANLGNVTYAMTDTTVTGDVTTTFTNGDGSTPGNVSYTMNDSTVNGSVTNTASNFGSFDLQTRNSTITAGTGAAFSMTLGNNITSSDILVGDAAFSAADASALLVSTSGATVKQVNFELTTVDDRSPTLVDNGTSTFSNNSASDTVVFDINGNTTLDLTIDGDNTFTNGGAGELFDIGANDTDAAINLRVDNLTAAGTGTLREIAGATFEVFELTELNADNPGVTFNFDPAIGDFGDAAAAPNTTQFTQ